MSARPGRVKRIFDVPFPHPRTAELRRDPRFSQLEDEIWQELREEVVAASGAQAPPTSGVGDA